MKTSGDRLLAIAYLGVIGLLLGLYGLAFCITFIMWSSMSTVAQNPWVFLNYWLFWLSTLPVYGFMILFVFKPGGSEP